MLLGYVPVTADYFEVTGIPITAGRPFDNRDRPQAEPATILSESAARTLYADEDPIGRMVFGLSLRVAGTAADAVYATDGDQPPAIHRALTQEAAPGLDLLVNGRGDDVPDAGTVIESIRRTNPLPPIGESRIVGDPPPAVAAERRAMTWTITAATMLIGVQAFTTLYGTGAYAARRRRREHTLKIALGAGRTRIGLDALRASIPATADGLAAETAAAIALESRIAGLTAGAGAAPPGSSAYWLAAAGAGAPASYRGDTAAGDSSNENPESCGWAAAAIVAEHYEADTTKMAPEERWADKPLSMLDVKNATEAAGLETTAGAAEDLTQCSMPAIALVDSPTFW